MTAPSVQISLVNSLTPTNPIQQQFEQHELLKQKALLNKQLRLLQDNQSAIRKYYKCFTTDIKSTPKNIENFRQKIMILNVVEKSIREMRT